MTGPERPVRASRAPRPPSLPRALGLAAAAVAIAVGVFVVALAARAQRGGPPATEVLGSHLPPVWEPGAGGVGNPPPQPAGVPTPPAGSAPAAPPPSPLGQPRARYPTDETAPPLPGDPDASAVPGLEPPTPPPAPEEPAERTVESYTPPRLLDLPAPSYPRMGQRMGMEATVVLRVRVSSRGRVLDAEPIGETVGYGFETEAIRAARRARFAPAMRDGEPVTADARLAVKFRLDH